MAQYDHLDAKQLEQISQLPLEPIEYCHRWVELDLSKSYRKSCINALARATGLSANTIKDWGKNFQRRPQNIPYVLRKIDLLNQFMGLVETEQITLPSDFPQK